MTMNDHDDERLLGELRSVLQDLPSPAFAEGVKSRIRSTRSRQRARWIGASALAVAASVALLVSLSRSQDYPLVPSAPTVMAVVPPIPEALPLASAPVPVRVGTTGVARLPVKPTAPVALEPEPRLEVITNQPDVLWALWQGVAGEVVVAEDAAGPKATTATSTPVPIEIEPLMLAPVLVSEFGSKSRVGGGRVPQGQRSVKAGATE